MLLYFDHSRFPEHGNSPRWFVPAAIPESRLLPGTSPSSVQTDMGSFRDLRSLKEEEDAFLTHWNTDVYYIAT
jgi:hypothetical protein